MSDRDLARIGWNAIIVFGSMLYFNLPFWTAALIAFGVLGSCLVGYGTRWLLRGGVAMFFVVILMAIGVLPPADELKGLSAEVRSMTFTKLGLKPVATTAAAPAITSTAR
ncbi:MAG TPA: hypothetical protein VFB45_08970 [Pseudolabrys sp.]|nr:hypothetical protein [Pseudolabrys sp.]